LLITNPFILINFKTKTISLKNKIINLINF